MYIVKLLAAFMGWLLQKSLVTIIVVLLLAALAFSCVVCAPILLLIAVHKSASRFKNKSNGKE